MFDEAELEKAAGITLDTAIEQGLPRDTETAVEATLIAAAAAHGLIVAAHAAQLLVVGARGHGGFGGLLLGSVGHQVMTHAPCPVAVIR